MSFPQYPEYKDSGVEWLGEVPRHWDVYPIRALVEERVEKNSGAAEDNYLSLMANVGVIPYAEKGDVGNKKPDDLSRCKMVGVGDIVINSMNYGIGAYGLSDLKGVCSPVYIILRPILGKVLPRYALRVFENKEFQKLAQSFGQGILAHRAAIGWDDLKNIKISIPNKTEQSQLAAFLDYETARIDALVEEQQRLIALLKEKRQAVISHAVTKGLDPDVPMKDSGVEWLGEVPAHWDVVPLKRIVSRPITDGPHETPEFTDDGVPFVSAEAVSAGSIDFNKARFISRHDHARYSRKYSPELLDIFMVKSGATTGVTAIVEENKEFNIWSPLAVIRCAPRAHPYFVLNAMRSRNFQESVINSWSFGTQQNIGMGVIENLPIAFPPIDEQKKIANHLSGQNYKWDELIGEAKQATFILKERRSALISAAVTGKIDVRGWTPPADASPAYQEARMEAV